MVSYSACAAVALLARAAMHREHLHTGAARRRARASRRSCADWHQPVRILSVTGTLRGAQAATTASTICQRQRFVLHQRRARPLVADLLGRAAHVDVDDLRAAVDVVGARPRPSWARRCRRSAPQSAPARRRGWRGARSSACSTGRAARSPSRSPHSPRPATCTTGGTAGRSRPPSGRRTGCSPGYGNRCAWKAGRRGKVAMLKNEARL